MLRPFFGILSKFVVLGGLGSLQPQKKMVLVTLRYLQKWPCTRVRLPSKLAYEPSNGPKLPMVELCELVS